MSMRGLGDLISRGTKAFGIKECGGCTQRRETLNRWIPFRRPEPVPSFQSMVRPILGRRILRSTNGKRKPMHVGVPYAISGGSDTVIGPSDCSAATTNSAIASAASGDTLIFTCTGTVSWTATVVIPNTKGITLKVQNGTNTPKGNPNFPLTISSSADPIMYIKNETSTALNRVTGFKFQNTIASVNGAINVAGRGAGIDGNGAYRIDNNYFDAIQLPSADMEGTITHGGGRGQTGFTAGTLKGLIDNNTFHDCSYSDGYVIAVNEPFRTDGTIPTAGQDSWTRAFTFGDSDFLFIEDNLFESVTLGREARHTIEAIQGGRYVFRYNTVDIQHGISDFHEGVEGHGWCFCTSIGHGTRGGEIYSNTLKGTGSEIGNWILLRGGAWLVYDNTFSQTGAIGGNYVFLREYRAGSAGMAVQCSATCASAAYWKDYNCTDVGCPETNGTNYPLPEQIGANRLRESEPSYIWNNVRTGFGVQAPVVDTLGVQPTFIQSGRDYFTTSYAYTPYTYPHPLRGSIYHGRRAATIAARRRRRHKR